eukprot:1149400-Pelagomonas_calceolata.AAC.1
MERSDKDSKLHKAERSDKDSKLHKAERLDKDFKLHKAERLDKDSKLHKLYKLYKLCKLRRERKLNKVVRCAFGAKETAQHPFADFHRKQSSRQCFQSYRLGAYSAKNPRLGDKKSQELRVLLMHTIACTVVAYCCVRACRHTYRAKHPAWEHETSGIAPRGLQPAFRKNASAISKYRGLPITLGCQGGLNMMAHECGLPVTLGSQEGMIMMAHEFCAHTSACNCIHLGPGTNTLTTSAMPLRLTASGVNYTT